MSSDTVWHFEGIFLENFFSLTHYITAHSGSDVERQVRNAMRRSATELIVVLGGSDLDQWQDYRSNGRTFCGRQRVVTTRIGTDAEICGKQSTEPGSIPVKRLPFNIRRPGLWAGFRAHT